MAQKQRIIVIGNGMVGYKFCEKLAAKGLTSSHEVVVFGEEPNVAYDRVHLSEYFSGSTVADLEMAPRSWYADNNIELKTSEMIVDLDTNTKTIRSHSGLEMTYDKLVLATGSAAFVPPIEGVEKEGIFVYRTIEDLDQMIAYAKKAKTGAVIGGGLLGLEAAKALIDLKLDTHVIEFAPRLMPRQLDDKGSRMLESKLEDLGIKIHLNKATASFGGDQDVNAMNFSDDSKLDVDMVCISAGIRPRDELAKAAGIETGTRGGIVVDNFLKTSADDVFAIGECALHDGMIYGLVAPGYDMAENVAAQLAGDTPKEFTGFDMSTKLKLIGVDVASFGDPFGETAGSKSVVYENGTKGVYKRVNISADGKKLLGGVLVGDADDYNLLQQICVNEMAIPEDPEALIIKATGSENALGGVEALPDTAMICSCENVSKGDLCCSIKDDGNTELGDLKKATKAGTGCGGCLPMVKDVLNHTLKEMGVEVKNSICEHFDYSRPQLVDIIKVKKLTTFKEVLAEAGTGCGCEICKPAVSSILASLNNHLVLEQDSTLDTNDKFLANIQRGGTYSVVPRIPGGEITPDKLMALGRIGKKYQLYTKITGGQRVDFFGARIDQLPDIWEELVAEGFETGQAYGKSLRTVKSCVGNTWCRYGVGDSVGFAIELENRYKGLRSPHKIKFGVSGCTRECAEAQNKDFGLIATEKGWALYTCGNGGTKPQHGPLFAIDIDDATCMKYIDRIIAFYIRTAAPLERTATWFNKLEGGLKYLQDVVINDSLGICDELDAHIQHHIDTYKCEWRDVVEDPEKRAKFTHFVNSSDADETIEWVDVRGQRIPKPW